MRKKKRKAVKIVLTTFLILFAVICLGTIGYLYISIQERRQIEQYKQFAEQYEKEERQKAEEEKKKEKKEEKKESAEEELPPLSNKPVPVGAQTFTAGFQAHADQNTVQAGEEDVLSEHAILIDLSTDRIAAQKGDLVRIYPASMTKILTILVAAEHIENLDDTFTMTPEIVNECLTNGCSAAGFVPDEVIPVKDLFYGTILPSGGEAAIALATYTAGSQEAFVELMNQKIRQLGLSETTHFTNCVGIYDDEHYSTVLDIAMILKAAVENEFCREVLKEHVYYTTATPQNPEGLILSNWFLRKIEDKDSGGLVTCAKTGFVEQSGFCAASYFVSNSDRPYICVTANTYNDWRCIYDHVAMYKLYAG